MWFNNTLFDVNLITTFGSLDFFRSFFIAKIDNIKSAEGEDGAAKTESETELKMNLNSAASRIERQLNLFHLPSSSFILSTWRGAWCWMAKRQCVAINSVSFGFLFLWKVISPLFWMRLRLTMIVRRCLQLASPTFNCCWSDHPHVPVCLNIAKNISLSSEFIYFPFFSLLSCERFFAALFPWISIAQERTTKIERERLMMLKSSTKWNGKIRIDRFFLLFSRSLSFLDYHLHCLRSWERRSGSKEKVSVSSNTEPNHRMTLNSHSKSPHDNDDGQKGANKMGENLRKMRNSSDHRRWKFKNNKNSM